MYVSKSRGMVIVRQARLLSGRGEKGYRRDVLLSTIFRPLRTK
jgi:hypothetical protein